MNKLGIIIFFKSIFAKLKTVCDLISPAVVIPIAIFSFILCCYLYPHKGIE